jgi:hypothetical protein
VAPYGYLIGTLRDKKALVIPGDFPPALVSTDANPAKPAMETYQADATLGDDGTLTGNLA